MHGQSFSVDMLLEQLQYTDRHTYTHKHKVRKKESHKQNLNLYVTNRCLPSWFSPLCKTPSISRKYINIALSNTKTDDDMQGETVTSVIMQPSMPGLEWLLVQWYNVSDSTCSMIQQHVNLVKNRCFFQGSATNTIIRLKGFCMLLFFAYPEPSPLFSIVMKPLLILDETLGYHPRVMYRFLNHNFGFWEQA